MRQVAVVRGWRFICLTRYKIVRYHERLTRTEVTRVMEGYRGER